MKCIVPKVIIAILVIASGYLGYRVFALERQLYRAEYFVQAGMLSTQRVCTEIITVLRQRDVMTTELRDLAWSCYGFFLPHERKEHDYLFTQGDPGEMAEALHDRIKRQRRIPWRSLEPVRRDWLPAQYLDGTEVH
jgi:hypothetical protein